MRLYRIYERITRIVDPILTVSGKMKKQPQKRHFFEYYELTLLNHQMKLLSEPFFQKSRQGED
jgi:hypothetical protein